MLAPEKTYTVAVVDDNVDAADLLEMVLERAGYKVIVAHSMQEAYDKLIHLPKLDALVTDYALGDGTGTDLVHKLTMCDKAPDLRILISGSLIKNTGRLFDYSMVKPVLTHDLLDILTQHLTRAA